MQLGVLKAGDLAVLFPPLLLICSVVFDQFTTSFVPQFPTYKMGEEYFIYLSFPNLKRTRMAFCLADTTGYGQDWRLQYAELFGECSATCQYL